MDEIKEMKCNYCKVFLPVYKFSTNRKDKLNKSCDECREKQKIVRESHKCEHGKRKTYCKDCGGSSICKHNKEKSKCRECGGSAFCEHNKRKVICKECKGVSICEHNRTKSHCKECKGISVCLHNKIKSKCKDCKGGSICEHNLAKYSCKECNGNGICKHSIEKTFCIECGGGSLCKHKKRNCKECNPNKYLKTIVSRRVHHSLKSNKSLHSIEYLGCDIKTYREYLEPLFIDGMTWENQGEWHIDHITPIMYNEDGNPPTLEVVIERLHYKNTQPLWAKDNLAKGNRFIG